MKIKAILFDFDGVLANSFEHIYALNKMAMAAVGIELSENQYRDFFMGNIHRGFREFIKDDAMYEKFLETRLKNFGKYYSKVKLFPETGKFISGIKEKFALAVISSGDRDWIEKLLKNGNIYGDFRFIYGSADYSKEQKIILVLKRLKLYPQEAILISDTCGDIILAKKLGLKTVGVGWGFHSLGRIFPINPDFMAGNFEKLNSYLIN